MPELLTFDIFGTVVDWRRGLSEDCARAGRPLRDGEFDAIVDHQGAAEQQTFRPYREITVASLRQVIGLSPEAAERIGAGLGHWPLHADSSAALARLQQHAPCVAMTNSDRAHREGVEAQLLRPLDGWLCAEDLGAYKPDARFWRALAAERRLAPSREWWHVSAYADYDLATARALGLTCVYVGRPHARPGPHHVAVADLTGLADLLEGR